MECHKHKSIAGAEFAHARLILLCISAATLLAAGGCKSLRRDPDKNVISARQMSLRGLEAVQQGEWKEAETYFANAVRTNPVDERAHVQYAELLWRRGVQDSAIEHLEGSVKLSGGDPALLVRLGEMYLAQGDTDRAWSQAEQAIQANRELACAWALRGDVHRRRDNMQAALADYHRSLSYEGHCPHVQLALAEIYRQQNRPRRALSTLDTLAGHYPPSEVPQDLLLERGLALKALARYERAVEVLSRAAQQGDPSAEVLFHLAEAQLSAGDAASARLAVVAALAQQPAHVPSQELMARIEQQQQRMTAAVDRY
jgi:tetratricopeptide (TPR) repeat protein